MKTYRMDPTRWNAAWRRMVLLFVVIFSVVLVIALGMVWANQFADVDWQDPDLMDSLLPSLISFGIFVVLFPLFVAFSIRRLLRQQRALWESIQVELGGNFVSRSQVRIPRLIIQRAEITEIQETNNGLCVRTANRSRSLAIPKSLEGYDEIKNTLAQWAPLRHIQQRERWTSIATLISLVLGFGVLFFVWNFWIVLVVGVALIAFYVYFYWQLLHTEGVDPKFRRNMLFGVGFIVFIFIMRIVALR